MANPLNLYATKVFAEHPLGLWALDDKADYVSIIPEADQDLNNWTSSGVSSVVDGSDEEAFGLAVPSIPFPEVFVNGIIGDPNNEGTLEFISPTNIDSSDINPDLQTISVSTYVYSFTKSINFELGFYYTDPVSLEEKEVFKSARLTPTLAWAAVSETFVLPESFSNLRLLLRATYSVGEYKFVINGIMSGQWAEEFQLTSFGTSLTDVPATIAIQATQGLEAKAYGLLGSSGYYIADNNYLVAKNAGIPLVYGSQNCTVITPKSNSPSLIVPGFGFMNSSGQYNKLTAEFWIKIQSRSVVARKIFGPIQSDDGLYVEGPFLKLKIGDSVMSHFIREWDRPMLVDIRLTPRKTDLIINGEIVGSMELDPAAYAFPAKISGGLEQDWLGFYAYDDVPIVQVDCVGIYPYEVSALVAKRRFVYGQGVQIPTDIKGLDASSSVFIDYPFAKYAKNFYFPSSSKWTNGNVENLIQEDDALRLPRYTTPSIRFTDKTYDQWFSDLSDLQQENDTFITLKPNGLWDSTDGHIAFTDLNVIKAQTSAFYGVFETTDLSLERKTLFEIVNSTTGNSVHVYYEANAFGASSGETVETEQSGTTVTVSGKRHGLRTGMKILITGTDRIPSGYYEVFVISDTEFSYTVSSNDSAVVEKEEDEDFLYAYDATIYYTFNFKEESGSFSESIFYEATGHGPNKKFMAGIDIERFSRSQGETLEDFFSNRQNLKIYVGGREALVEGSTFDGKIHRIGFSSSRNLQKIQHLFNEDGIPVDYENVFDSFGLTVYDAGDDYFGNDPDYWETTLDGGDPYDFQSIKAIEHIATYTLIPQFDMGMFILDIAANGYWEDYVPLSYFAKEVSDAFGDKNFKVSFIQANIDYPKMERFDLDGNYDTSDNLVKAYVSFQYLKEGSNLLDSNFTSVEPLNDLAVVQPDGNWITTKYEIVDGTIIYPPKDVDFRNISINFYLELNVEGILSRPLKTRSLQASSQSFSDSPNKIGTKLGAEIVPFKKSGQYFNYRTVPPFAIYKGSTPYLYNTADSGIAIRSTYNNRNNVGMSVPINKNQAEFFKIGSMQIFLKYGKDLFPDVPIKIFEINAANDLIQFFLMADSSNRKRGQIYALNATTREIERGVNFYENGNIVNRPVMYPNTWMALGLSFPGFLDFSNTIGALRITSPIMFDNFSFYQTTFADDEERFGLRQWFGVSSLLGESLDWSYWSGLETVGGEVLPNGEYQFIWQQVKYFSDAFREELNARKIYQIYTGTDRNISESDQLFLLKDYQYKSFNGIKWAPSIVSAI